MVRNLPSATSLDLAYDVPNIRLALSSPVAETRVILYIFFLSFLLG